LSTIIGDDSIYDILKGIVSNAHTHPQKKEVRHKSNGYQIACPYCGDSTKNPSNFRGNFNSLLNYRCFNDGCEKRTDFINFCKDFGHKLDTTQTKTIYSYLDNHMTKMDSIQDEFMEYGLSNLLNLSDLVKELNDSSKIDTHKISDFKPIENNSPQFWYLYEKRGIPVSLHKHIYQCNLHITSSWKEPCIAYLNRSGDKILGMQLRNIKSDQHKRIFKIFPFVELYKYVYGEDKLGTLPPQQRIMYNKLSYLYGILNVNFERTITIFEGYGDAILFPNSVSGSGVDTDFRFLEENDLDIRYFFDNDIAGNRKAQEVIKKGISIFLWRKLITHIIEVIKPKDTNRYKEGLATLSDLTKLNKEFPDAYTRFKLTDFFSRDKYDLIYIPYMDDKKGKYKKRVI